MPIYVYACSSCGLQQDVLQKMSDAPLAACPACGTQTFSKQLTAAGFQLKGNGYYVTDFKNGSSKPDAKADVVPATTPAPVSTAASVAARVAVCRTIGRRKRTSVPPVETP